MSLHFTFGTLAFLLFGLLLMATGVYQVIKQRRRQRDGLLAPATILALEKGPRLFALRARFRTADGREVETTLDATFVTPEHEPGQPVTVRYDPADPSNADLAEIRPRRPTVLLLIGMLIVGAALLELLGVVR